VKLQRQLILLLILSSAILSSCQQGSAPSEPEDIFPTQVGTTWKYNVSIDTATAGNNNFIPSGSIEVRIVGIQQLDGREATVVVTKTTPLVGEPTTDTAFYAYENNRRDQLVYLRNAQVLIGGAGGIGDITGFRSGWYPLIRTSGGVGSTYTILNTQVSSPFEGVGTVTIAIRAEGKVEANEQITVNNRTYNTIRVSIDIKTKLRTPPPFSSEITIDAPIRVWVARNVGIVRQEATLLLRGAGTQLTTTARVRQELQSITGN